MDSFFTSRAFRALPLIGLCLLAALPAGAQQPKANFIRLVVPESDTVESLSPVYRLSAGTLPGNSLTVNGRALKVYPSGAVAGLLDLAVGQNLFMLAATDRAGNTVTKTFVVNRRKGPETSPDVPVQIDTIMMEPSRELWLGVGDRLEVQCKGSPSCTVSCDLGIPMKEVPPSEAGGLRGVYRGARTILPGETIAFRQVTFRIRSAAGDTASAISKGKLWVRDDFPLIGVTRTDRPALAYGLGEDRLGGAKMSILVSGVRLAITGKFGSQYRVALAPGREAFIGTESVELLQGPALVPGALTENMNVYGDDAFDYVSVNMPVRLPFASSTESTPSRIIVDVFGATSNSNWIIQTLTAREITNVSYTQVSAQVFRIMIELRHKQIWGYEISYTGAGLLIKVRRQPERLKIKALTFALDAGHGGTNLGAIGSTGAREKDVNLAVVRQLKAMLEDRGARVILTRDGDNNVSMTDRAQRAISSGADILISVHSNSIGYTSNPEDTRGTATFYKHLCYRTLGMAILKNVLKTSIPLFGNVGGFNFTLNGPTEMPNVLVEMAFISNPLDEMRLLNEEFQHEIAERIVDGVDDFLDECDE